MFFSTYNIFRSIKILPCDVQFLLISGVKMMFTERLIVRFLTPPMFNPSIFNSRIEWVNVHNKKPGLSE